MSDNRPIVYFDPSVEAWVYRASSAGASSRTLAAARQGMTPLAPPDYLMKAAEAGNRFEKIVKTQMRIEGYKISGEQGSTDVEVVPGILVRGHLDARHCIPPKGGEDRMLEVKSMSQAVFNEWTKWGFERFYSYAAQLSVYMHGEEIRRGHPVETTYAVVNRDYEGDTPEIEYRTFKEPPVPWQEIANKIQIADWFGERGELPVCDSKSRYQCPYSYICDKDEILFEEVEDGSDEMLRQLAEQYDIVRKLEGELKNRKSDIRSEIVVALRSKEKVRTADCPFSFKASTSENLDTTLLRKVLTENDIELDDFYNTTEGNPSLRVTRLST